MSAPGHENGDALTGTATPHEHDVLCGRGGGTQNHAGNVEYRALVAKNKKLYVILGKRDKNLLVDAIIKAVLSQNPPGRFLAKDTSNDTWYDIGKDKAFAKTAQALREGAPAIRISMEQNKAGLDLHVHDPHNEDLGSPTKKFRKLVMEFPCAYEYEYSTNAHIHMQQHQHASFQHPHVTPDSTTYVSSNAHMDINRHQAKGPYNNKSQNTMQTAMLMSNTTMADITDPIFFFPDQQRSVTTYNGEIALSKQQQQHRATAPNSIQTSKLSASINEIIDDGVSDIFGDVSMECMENVMQKFDDSYRSQISTGAHSE